MKQVKRILAFALVLIMLVPVFATSASALDSQWRAYFRTFPVNKRTSYTTNYTKAIQRFLLCYSATSDIIADNGGVDGRFGTATENAVKQFQSNSSLTVDGSVGPNTWAMIATYLTDDYGDPVYTVFLREKKPVIAYKWDDDITVDVRYYYFYNTDGSLGDIFRTQTF